MLQYTVVIRNTHKSDIPATHCITESTSSSAVAEAGGARRFEGVDHVEAKF